MPPFKSSLAHQLIHRRVAPVLGGVDTPEGRAVPLSGIPLGRISTPQDIANAACFLASDEANFLTVRDTSKGISQEENCSVLC